MVKHMPESIEWVKARPVAHRGLHDLGAGVPENSLAAFAKAAEAGYPVELDVRLLGDGQPAVFHDETLERLTGAEGALASLDAAGAKALRLGGTDERIPLLGEALETLAGRVPVFVELKNPDGAGPLEEAVWGLLAAYGGAFAVESFNPASLQWFLANAPRAVRGQLVSEGDHLAERMPLSQAHFLACRFDRLPHPAVAKYRQEGLPVLGWTTRSPKDHAQAMRHCDNVVFEGYQP